MSRGRVCALVEAAGEPGRNPLLPPLARELAAAGVELVVWDPTGRLPLPVEPPPADLYLLKGDHPAVLGAAAAVAAAGGPCLNPFPATAAAADKALTLGRLAAAGVPVPVSEVVGTRPALAAALAEGARVVKPVRGAHGDGVRLLGPGDEDRAAAGPWLVQEPVQGPGWELKLYGVGDRVAVRRTRFAPGVVDGPRLPVERPAPGLVELGRACAAATELVLWGADVVPGPDGPVVVDVNAFPGYRTVAEAPARVAGAVLDALR